jgi:cell division protein FtsN
MKKLVAMFIVVAFFVSFSLISCGPSAEPPKPAPPKEEAKPAPAPEPAKAEPAKAEPAPAPEPAKK